MTSLALLETYKDHFDVAALERFKKVRYTSLQTATNDDTFIDVVQEDGSESISVTWNPEGQRHVLIYFCVTIQQQHQ